MAQPESLLEITTVEAVYDHAIVALHEVSLELRQGEILALLGANGAGKTTTLKALSNLLPAERGAISKGEIRFAGIRDATVYRLNGRKFYSTGVLFAHWVAVV